MDENQDTIVADHGHRDEHRDPVEVSLERYIEHADSGSGTPIEAFVEELEHDDDKRRLREAEELLSAGLPGQLARPELLAGRYRVVRELGRGGYGVVYEAHDEELDRRVALKSIRAAGTTELEHLEKALIEESRSLARVESPDIIEVFDVVRGDDQVFLVIELVRGVDLARVLAAVRGDGSTSSSRERLAAWGAALGAPAALRRREDWYTLVAGIGLRLARALESAHVAGVLHRDLKPANVLLDSSGEPKLVDFGLAYRAGTLDGASDRLAGTPEYFAPEQVRKGESGASRSSDIYGLGLVLYEALTLERVYRRSREESWPLFLERIKRGEHAPASECDPHVPPALAAIVERALAPEPENRYATAGELASDLERVLAGAPPRHASIAATTRFAMNARRLARNPRAWAATFLVAALAGWGLTWLADPPPMTVQSARSFDTATGVTRTMPLDATLGATDDLGVHVSGGRAGVLYALSVFRPDEGGDVLVVPTRPLLTSEPGHTPADYGLELPPGEHDVVVAIVDEENHEEGMMVYVCDEREQLFEDWLRGLDELLEEEAVLGGIERGRAIAMLERLAGEARGGSPSSRSMEERRAAYESIRAATEAETGVVRLFERSFEVEP